MHSLYALLAAIGLAMLGTGIFIVQRSPLQTPKKAEAPLSPAVSKICRAAQYATIVTEYHNVHGQIGGYLAINDASRQRVMDAPALLYDASGTWLATGSINGGADARTAFDAHIGTLKTDYPETRAYSCPLPKD